MPSADYAMTMTHNNYGTSSNGGEKTVKPMERKGTGWWDSFSTVIKGVVGSGILALPVAFKETGLALGSVCLLLLAVVSLYSHRIIILSVQALRKKGMGPADGRIEFQDLSKYSLGKVGEGIAAFAAISTQLGGCTAFLVFIGENMAEVAGTKCITVLMALMPVLIALALIRDAKLFGPTSHIGNAALVLAISTVFWFGFSESPPRSVGSYEQFKFSGLPIFFGIGVYTFSAHCEVVSIEQVMTKREDFLSVLNSAFWVITILYFAFGALCYMFFAENTSEIIFDNLGNSPFLVFVKICISVALLLQYPIVLLPASVTFEDILNVTDKFMWMSVVRVLLVIFTVLLAVLIPSFEVVTSLVGAFSNGIVAFVLPPLFYMLHVDGLGPVEKAVNWTIIIGGGLLSLYSSFAVIWCLYSPDSMIC
mmetsp:Transcript_3019/g.4480  ORF Transcript_3019/g.4480 Transcript_3019/m.4480 type:complete len:422 (+) Transcript_3019:30-1295(+)